MSTPTGLDSVPVAASPTEESFHAPSRSPESPAPPPVSLAFTRHARVRKVCDPVVEGGIYAVSFTAVVTVFLILLFVVGESLPILLQGATTARSMELIDSSALDTVPAESLARYLGRQPEDLKGLDKETLRYLVEVRREEMAGGASNPDFHVNAVSYRNLLWPFPWDGYDRPAFVWQPESSIPKFNIVPLLLGTLKCTLIALLFAVPLAVLSAIYVSQVAPHWLRQLVKPFVELLAGIPSVVLGFFALMVLATWLQTLFGYGVRLNALVAGVALGVAVIPLVFTISEEALRAVPGSYKDAAIALGARPFDVALRVVVPAALPGIFAAVVLGFGRAVGETMVVLMASGNAWVVSASPTDSARTLTATIAAELAETVRGSPHYQVLFFLGALLFTSTLLSNLLGSYVIGRMRFKMTGVRG